MKSKLFVLAVCLSALCGVEQVDELEKTSRPPTPVPMDLGKLETLRNDVAEQDWT